MDEQVTPRAPTSRRRKPWILYAAGAFLLIGLGGAGLSCLTVRIPESGSRQTILFYAAPTDLFPGAPLEVEELEDRLHRLEYRPAEVPAEPGQFRKISGGLEIFLRPFRYPGREFSGGILRVLISDGEVDQVEPLDPFDSEDLRLEPERIAGFEGLTGAVLDPIRLADAPQLLMDAVIAIEDRRFWHHPGIDPVATARAVLADLRHRQAAQGGSTLTQQLARSLYLHNRKTVLRKLQEAVLAIGLELRYSKREILEAYLNAVYWGHWGSFEIRGAREASLYYLGTEIEKADAAGIALLVGLIHAPNATSPYSSTERALKRRDFVLGRLGELGVLSEDEVRAGLGQPLPSKKAPIRNAEASYFLDAARRELEERGPKGILSEAGTSVFTTLDLKDQGAAVSALQQGLKDLERNYRRLRRKQEPVEGAVVVLDPRNGEVRALVGGRDYSARPFNRATEALRQPGSLFKSFVYLATILHPEREDGSYWTPATIVEDEPFELRVGKKVWRPENYDHEYRGLVSLRQALEHSLNIPTARVGHEVGVDRVANAAHDLGIQTQLEEVPSLALGTSEVTLLEITAAYGCLAAEGRGRAPTFLKGCAGSGGKIIQLAPLEDPPGIEPEEAYLMTSLLQGVIESGTGRGAHSLGLRGPAAGKTGTTDEYRDAWFVGYTPRRVAGVWVGFDREDAVGLSGAAAALPIWVRVMREIQGPAGDGEFHRPPGVVSVPIDPESGLLATLNCPEFMQEDFLEGTEPQEECDLHREGFLNRMRRFFGM